MADSRISTFVPGDTWQRRVRIWADFVGGTLLPLDGATYAAGVRATRAPGTILVPIVVTGPDVAGWLTLRIEKAATAAMASGYWDLPITFPSGDQRTYFPGRRLLSEYDAYPTT